MKFLVATIDLDSTKDPSYKKLNDVLAEHGLVCLLPKKWSSIPQNTYLGKIQGDKDLNGFAREIAASVKRAGLFPTRFLVAATDEMVAIQCD